MRSIRAHEIDSGGFQEGKEKTQVAILNRGRGLIAWLFVYSVPPVSF